MVLIIGVAVVGVSTGRGVWEWAVYSDLELDDWFMGVNMVFTSGDPPYSKVRQKRWSWLPGQDVIRIEIPKDEYETMLEGRNRRAKGGQ